MKTQDAPLFKSDYPFHHTQVGITTVAELRKAGGDVVRTAGRSPYHATLTGLTPEQVSRLLTPTVPNPERER